MTQVTAFEHLSKELDALVKWSILEHEIGKMTSISSITALVDPTSRPINLKDRISCFHRANPADFEHQRNPGRVKISTEVSPIFSSL
jgi:hypothetical protein